MRGWWIAGVLLAAAAQVGAEPPSTPAPAPVVAPAALTAAEKTAQDLWTQMANAYIGLASFKETITQTVTGTSSLGPKVILMPPITVVDHVLYQKPNRFTIDTEAQGMPQGPLRGILTSDGDSLIAYSGAFNQYRKQKAPASPSEAVMDQDLRAALFDAPDAFAPHPAIQIYQALQRQTGSKDLKVSTSHEAINAIPVDVIRVELGPGPNPLAQGQRLESFQDTWYLGHKDHLPVRKVQHDVVSGAGPNGEMRQDVTITRSYDNRTLDLPLDKSAFAFNPPVGARLVAEWEAPAPSPGSLQGKPAPSLSLKTLDGKPVSLSDYKGKTVLLDFLAARVPLCKAQLPQMQKIADEFKDKGLVVLGISRDAHPQDVSTLLKDDRITFTVLADKAGAAAAAYSVTTVPRVILIDAQGVVRADLSGYAGTDAAVRAALAEAGLK